jgi:hypothetical protein
MTSPLAQSRELTPNRREGLRGLIREQNLAITEDVDRKSDYADVEDKRSQSMKYDGAAVSARFDAHVGGLKGHRQISRKICEVPIIWFLRPREAKATTVLTLGTAGVEHMRVMQCIDQSAEEPAKNRVQTTSTTSIG